METFRSRKSNSSAVTPDRSFTRGGGLREGNRRVQMQRKLPKLASDSSSQSSDTTDEELLEWRSSKNTVGTQMKNLLANEMSKEAESKRRSPNVIARLMGLDGSPAQQPSHKQQTGSLGNSVQRIGSTKKSEKNSTLYTRQSSRNISKEEQEFKDVFEVLDASKMESNRYPSQGNGDSKPMEAEMSFIQQKLTEAKRLSRDEKLQDSKEFRDTIDDLDSKKDLLLKILEQPDSLLTKHLHDLQGVPSQCHCSSVSATESLYAPVLACENSRYKIGRETPRKNPRKPHPDFVTPSQSKHAAYTSSKSENIQLTGKDESNVLPTRIVVLKPNLGRVQKPTRTLTSPHSSLNWHSDCSKQTRVSNSRSRKPELGGRNKLPDDLGPSRNKSRESREMAKERNTFRTGSTKFSTPRFRGCSEVESLSNRSENDSAIESEVASISSRNSIDLLSRRRPSSSHTTETYVSREARKRLSERWKLTHRSVDIGEISRSSTLREMLSISDSEVRPARSDLISGGKGSSDKLETNNRPAGWAEPLGISSRDGWKEGCISNLSRSRSLPASSTDAGSPKTGMRHETTGNKMCMMPNKVRQRGRDRMINGISTKREGASSKTLRFHNHARNTRIVGRTSGDGNNSQNQVQRNAMEDIQVKQKWTDSESASTVSGTALIPVVVADTDAEMMAMHAKPIDPEISASTFAEANSSTDQPNVSSSQESSSDPPEKGPVPTQQSLVEPESTASSKEGDQPSPVSVLETPFLDDLSSGSECFETLSADLHGLRLQLQLLKLESEQYTEDSMLISSDEEPEEVFVSFSEKKGLGEQNSEFSYLVDLLQDSGLNDADPDTFRATWHSSECPVNPMVFEELEKSYSSDTSWTRSERKLLFDRVNSTLLAIYQQVVNPHPWAKPASGIASGWTRNGLEDSLQKVLASKDKKWSRDAAENVLARQSQWLDFGNDIDAIGREIERILTEELVQELLAM